MADEDIVKKVVIKGEDEAGQKFNLIADIAESAFGRIGGAVRALNIALTSPLGIIISVTAAVVALGSAVSTFANNQAKAQVALNETAQALGTTRDEVVAMRTALAQSGLTAEQTGTLLDRMSQRIGAAWSQIAQDIRKGPAAMQEARIGIEAAQIGISTAMTNQGFAAREWASRLQANALTVSEAYNRVKNAAQEAASQTNNDALGVKSAQLAVREAQLRANGGGSAAEQASLAKDRSALALEQANQALADAELKQAKDLENQPLAQQRAELSLQDAQTKQAKDQESAGPAIQKAALDFDSAVLNFAQAVDKMSDVTLKDLPTVINAIQNKNAEVLKDVSPETFAHAIQQIAQENREASGKTGQASTAEVIKTAGDILKNLGDVVAQSQKIAVARELGTPRGLAISGEQGLEKLSELLPDLLKRAQETQAGGTDQNQANAEAVRSSAASLEDMQQNMARLAGTSDTVSAIAQANTQTWTNILQAITDLPKSIAEAIKGTGEAINASAGAVGPGLAGGGAVFGPGTATSDSIPARLSHGEFVVRAAAVRAYGSDLFHALNDMAINGFAMGGLVPGPGIASMRFAEGGLAGGGQSVVNLSIDGNRFDGLKAPQDVAQKLTSYAISRQTAQTGRTPSWVR